MPLLSAALIVRNESKFIDDCLTSLVGIVDEIVIVDTGSDDDTVEKARRYPVKLRHFRWRDDFSAARNFAIEQSSGDWILYIDADERFEAPDRRALFEMLADPAMVGLRLRLQPRVDWTDYSELRLFRNDPRIRFRGVIHESISLAIGEVARADGNTIGSCDARLRHVGYEGVQSHKNARNIPLLRAYLDREPTRIFCWWHLGDSLRMAGDEAGAIEAWTRGIEVVRAQANATQDLNDSPPFTALIKLLEAKKAPVDDLLDEALARFPQHLSLQRRWAQRAIERGELVAAQRILEALVAIDADAFFDPDMAYAKSLFRYRAPETLALCHFRAGRFAQAAELYRRAALGAPDPGGCELKARLAEMRSAGQPNQRT